MYSLVGYQDGRTFHNATLLCLLLTEVTPALYFSGPQKGASRNVMSRECVRNLDQRVQKVMS